MSDVRLYIDDDSEDKRVLAALRKFGIDVLIPADIGLSGAADETHLRVAAGLGRVVVSCNVRDFQRLHRDWLLDGRSHAGLILVVQTKYSIGERVNRIERVARSLSAEDFVDRCEFLNHWG